VSKIVENTEQKAVKATKNKKQENRCRAKKVTLLLNKNQTPQPTLGLKGQGRNPNKKK